MSTVSLVPTVRRRRLGSLLRDLRHEAGVTLDVAARAVGWDASKLSRIENARATIKDIAPLLAVYGVTDPEKVRTLEALAHDAGRTAGWWQTYSGVVAPALADYISLETDAEAVHAYASSVIPGLLQTAAYASSVIAANAFTRGPAEITALVEVRRARQAVLSRPDRPLRLSAVIDEAVLRRRFPDRSVMRDQLQRLIEVSDMPNVTLQVMPLDAAPHPGGVGAFDVVSFPPPMPGVVEMENLRGSVYVEGTQDVTLYEAAFERISDAALSESDSLTLIKDIS